MNKNIENDLKESTIAFQVNKAKIAQSLNWMLISLELESNPLNDLFDIHACTDIIAKAQNGMVYTIANRCNFKKDWYEKITIRYKRTSGASTEYEKTIKSIQARAMTASIGIQIDVDRDDEYNMLRAVVYDRLRLFDYIKENIDFFHAHRMHTVKSDGNLMLYCSYNDLKDWGIQHKVI